MYEILCFDLYAGLQFWTKSQLQIDNSIYMQISIREYKRYINFDNIKHPILFATIFELNHKQHSKLIKNIVKITVVEHPNRLDHNLSSHNSRSSMNDCLNWDSSTDFRLSCNSLLLSFGQVKFLTMQVRWLGYEHVRQVWLL